jgi:methionine-rich copper-binding protein CopC
MRPRVLSLRVLLPTGLAALAIITHASLVSAHSQYVSSTPASNATVTTLPSTLQVTYSEELASVQFTITGPDGSNAATGPGSIDLGHRTNASVPLRNAGPGQYTVVWHNVSGDDGDPNDGSFAFTLNAPAGQPQPPTSVPSSTTMAPAGAQLATAAPACVDTGIRTPGINDARVDTYCKRQAIRDKNRGLIDEKTFNYDLSSGMGLQTALTDAMKALKGGS